MVMGIAARRLMREHKLPTFPTFGSCPNSANSGSGSSAATAVVTKWGGSQVAVRQFNSALTSGPNHPSGASLVHTSYKPALLGVIAGTFDADIVALANRTPAGDVLEIWHEPDHKEDDVSIPDSTYANFVAAKNHFYDVVKATNPHVLVANTLTGWLFDPVNTADKDRWMAIKADVLGLDLDGVASDTGYPNFLNEFPVAVRQFDKYAINGYKYLAIPEFCHHRITSDPSGSGRVNFMNNTIPTWRDSGKLLYVCWFDYNFNVGDTNEIGFTNELAAWQAFVDWGAGL